MWDILESSPELMDFVAIYMLMIAPVMVYATVMAEREPNRSDGRLLPRMDSQEFWRPGRCWSGIDSDCRFAHVQDSGCVDPDRRFTHVEDSGRNFYAKMFADASEKIRL